MIQTLRNNRFFIQEKQIDAYRAYRANRYFILIAGLAVAAMIRFMPIGPSETTPASLFSIEAVPPSTYPISEDQDQDNIPNWIDLDDDND